MLSSTCNYVCEESKQHVHCSPLQAHDACSSSKPKRIVNQADVLEDPTYDISRERIMQQS